MAAGQNIEVPKHADGFLGPQPKFDQYALRTVSHNDPIIVLDGNHVTVQIERTQTTRVMAKLVPYGTQKECANHVLMNVDSSGSLVDFHVICPGIGWFKLHIFAIPPSQAGKLIGVYNYFILTQSISVEGFPFPKQYGQWRDDGCCLYEPKVLHPGLCTSDVVFKVRVPGADKVGVKAGNDWSMLEPGEGADMWEGTADLSQNYPPNTIIKLNCNYGGANYCTLLEFKI